MKHSILLFVFYIIFFAVSVFGQEARKVNEIGDYASCADVTIRSHTFFEELKELKGSMGYVIVYNGKLTRNAKDNPLYPHFNEAKAEIENIKSRTRFFRFDRKRIVFIEGGLREYFTVEYWVVPDGATPPKPTPTLTKLKYQKGKAYRVCEVF